MSSRKGTPQSLDSVPFNVEFHPPPLFFWEGGVLVLINSLEPSRLEGKERAGTFVGHRTTFQGLIPHSFQSAFFAKTCRFPRVSRGWLERNIPGKNGEGTPRGLLFGRAFPGPPPPSQDKAKTNRGVPFGGRLKP